MLSIEMRPTFDLIVPAKSDWVVQQLKQIMQHETSRFTGQAVGHHITIAVVPEDRHFWSPWLTMEVFAEVDENEPGTMVHGRFHPNPSIWSGYMLGYLALGTLMSFAAVLGLSQMIAESSPWGFIAVPVCMLLAGFMWWTAKVGQRLAKKQMRIIGDAVENALNRDETVAN